MPDKLTKIFFVIMRSLKSLINNDGIEHAGYMAFILLLCTCPAMVIFLSLVHILKISAIETQFLTIIQGILSHDIVSSFKSPMQELITTPTQNLMTVFLASYAWTSASFVEGLRTILNKIYKVHTPPMYLLRRLLSLLQFMLFIATIASVILLMFLIPKTQNYLPLFITQMLTAQTLIFLKNIMLSVVLFAITSYLYVIIPNAKVKLTQVLPGSLSTTILWIVVIKLFSENVAYYEKASIIYGSLWKIVLTMILFYVINLIFIYGAELNYALLAPESQK